MQYLRVYARTLRACMAASGSSTRLAAVFNTGHAIPASRVLTYSPGGGLAAVAAAAAADPLDVLGGLLV